MAKKITRLPETKSLFDILPKGTEGGKEFARIVDLLLFHAARKEGKKVGLLNDASGDYRGLDSFEGDVFREQGTIGYQYKFFPSPFSDKHRAEIKKSLARVAESKKKLKLTKWVLVTPQDLTESARRADGGDVSWFEGLREEMGLKFEIEHWGHRKLQGLFLETPALCLYYYPDLVQEGSFRRNTIQETRICYDDIFRELNSKIEFVGMSVYKPEATRGVPMEHIYIPLKVVPETVSVDYSDSLRLNPLSFLAPGTRHVILGDPGSGKSTLLKFLALVGLSPELQKRYQAKPDTRLPVLIILRRYANELKTRNNLSLLDYIRETVQADFTLNSADANFFDYYLESGQALLLFDGLDELPDPALKQTVSSRIRSLLITYPGNAAIVTSRIVGYENPFRFDEKEFGHYRVSPLLLPEIEQFVSDWYRVRIENPKERQENVDDLIRILRNEDHSAIRDLSQNPLLLTIIALVHRIDAVLPDERVVLYQKCTETLLNTWHTWKSRGSDQQRRGRLERRNRQRMEAIAYWMHTQGTRTEKGHRAIVSSKALGDFLSNYIEKNERSHEEEDSRDQAQDFLDFVKQKAGLLIEVGDASYSFVHLTFQEYLAASYIVTLSETGGTEEIWSIIGSHLSDSAWHEIIRLLLASLKSDVSQQSLVEKALKIAATKPKSSSAQLMGGFLLDGVEPAEDRVEDICICLLSAAVSEKSAIPLRSIVNVIRACSLHDTSTRLAFQSVFHTQWQSARNDDQRIALVLTLLASGWSLSQVGKLVGQFVEIDSKALWPLRLLFGRGGAKVAQERNWECLMAKMQVSSLTSPGGNLLASTFPAFAIGINLGEASRTAFVLTISSLSSGPEGGPFPYFLMHSCRVGGVSFDITYHTSSTRCQVLDQSLSKIPYMHRSQDLALHRSGDLALIRSRGLEMNRSLDRALDDRAGFWNEISNSSTFQKAISSLLFSCLDLRPKAHWEVALQTAFIRSVPERMVLLNPQTWRKIERSFAAGKFGKGEIYGAAWLLILDSGLWMSGVGERPDDSPFRRLAKLTREIDEPPLRLAHCIRDLAYGDKSRADDLVAMVKSDNKEYRLMFEDCLWLPRPGEKWVAKKERSKGTIQLGLDIED